MQSLIIVTFSWSSDAALMCFVIALHSFVVRSAFDSTFRLVVAEIYWRRVSNDGSYTCDGISDGFADLGRDACTRGECHGRATAT